MDKQMERRIDNLVEDEIRRGYRIKAIDPVLYDRLQAAHQLNPAITPFKKVRFLKLTGRKKRQINEAVIARYHADLQNPAILSSERLKQINIERGEWSVEKDRRIEQLEDETSERMKALYRMGYSEDAAWTRELYDAAADARQLIVEGLNDDGKSAYSQKKARELTDIFDRWLGWDPERQGEYDLRYGSQQGGGRTYSPDRDYQELIERAPSLKAADAVASVDDLRNKVRLLSECVKLRKELLNLQVARGKMLAESVEMRRDTTEEYARLYYSTEVVDDNDVTVGPLTPTFDDLWDLPDEVLQWLTVELFFFIEGTPDVPETRAFLEQWGFIAAPPRISDDASSASSDASPGEPSSSTDLPPLEATVAGSST